MSSLHVEDIKRVYLLAEEFPEMSKKEISRRTGVTRSRIIVWLRDPARYSPWVDEVAIERALLGDQGVIAHLSLLEQQEFRARLAAMSPEDLQQTLDRFPERESLRGIAYVTRKRAA
jgi:hypothetical protein